MNTSQLLLSMTYPNTLETFDNERLEYLSALHNPKTAPLKPFHYHMLGNIYLHKVEALFQRIYLQEENSVPMRLQDEEERGMFQKTIVRLYRAGLIQSQKNHITLTPEGLKALLDHTKTRLADPRCHSTNRQFYTSIYNRHYQPRLTLNFTDDF